MSCGLPLVRFDRSANYPGSLAKDGKTVYAITVAFPADQRITIKSLAQNARLWHDKISDVKVLGVREKMKLTRDENGLQVNLPGKKLCDTALVLKNSL